MRCNISLHETQAAVSTVKNLIRREMMQFNATFLIISIISKLKNIMQSKHQFQVREHRILYEIPFWIL